ncbi:3-hydroxybutyrate dehydrogenase type 2 [Neorhizobium galegae bv. officinalis]|uniref:3-hydroxybutyrate dehydrogenase type 2 n=1 Tax=Neorhizobium galegae bv. officinalis TaxID=323656 RepID=A0A0T7FBZ3_NEOGA|nr:SDR family oxidoreductase [Neorhizobium galegae]CDZ32555.1 3-hydroxybutyrate dehydrogenase type 2 [Neorhizobium galegae bv. officinalis]
MVGRLAKKRALVTGAGQGIGRAIAIAFAEDGATVVATSRTPSKMADLADRSPAIEIIGLDVTDAADVKAVLGEAGPIDILVNCAGWVHNGSILECEEEDWKKSINQNATSAFRTMKTALPGMIERGSGAIVNVASVASSITGVQNRVAYGASKAALIGLTKAVARDVIATGVRVNALCPGTTLSPGLQGRIDEAPDPQEMRRSFISRQPMGRLGTVEEMAAAAVFLSSDEAAFMTGQILVIDGGQTL